MGLDVLHHPPNPHLRPRDDQAARSSLEAMVMTIPFINKLKVLAKISPPLAPPGPTSPVFETRGAVLAVEGSDPADAKGVEQVGAAIHRALLATPEVELRTWSDDMGPVSASASRDVGVGAGLEEDRRTGSGGGGHSADTSRRGSLVQATTGVGAGAGLSDLYVEYMQKVVQWHEKSQQVVKHVTTRPGSRLQFPGEGQSQSQSQSQSQGHGPLARRASEGEAISAARIGVGFSPASFVPPGSSSSSLSSSSASPSLPPTKIPVALLKGGFSLSLSDRYACRIPIADSYAPVDHWQWMATLWRGVVGADLVIYVKTCQEDDVGSGPTVEFKDSRIVVVKVVEGKGLDEKTERRLCFEVVEWLRGGSYKEGFGRE